jgi:hypothetical protein
MRLSISKERLRNKLLPVRKKRRLLLRELAQQRLLGKE